MEFNLSFLDNRSRDYLQRAIDGVNKAAVLHPGAWKYVSEGGLIHANKYQDANSIDPIAKMVFDEMEKDPHSGSSAGWTIRAVTNVAKDFPKWRHTVLENTLIHMKDRVDKFIENRYTEKFAAYADTSERWPVRRSQVLHSLEYSYLVNNVITEDEQALLEYLSKIENISHLENEVLIDMIQEELQKLY